MLLLGQSSEPLSASVKNTDDSPARVKLTVGGQTDASWRIREVAEVTFTDCSWRGGFARLAEVAAGIPALSSLIVGVALRMWLLVAAAVPFVLAGNYLVLRSRSSK